MTAQSQERIHLIRVSRAAISVKLLIQVHFLVNNEVALLTETFFFLEKPFILSFETGVL